MSVKLVGPTKPSRRMVLGMVPVLIVVLAVGFLAGMPSSEVPPVYAALCGQALNYACGGGDVTKTSALAVTHHTSPGYATSTVVQPDDGETWAITAQWCPSGGGEEALETAYVTVSWNGSAFALSNVQTTTNIVSISLCQGDTCDAGGGAVHGWSYKLIVDINDPDPLGKNLNKVTYATTSVDDGDLVMDPTRTHGDCYLGTAVSPSTQSFSATDEPPFTFDSSRCGFNCDVTGASVTLYYE